MGNKSDVAKAAAAIRADLRHEFPGIKFSVKTSRASLGSTIEVEYFGTLPKSTRDTVARICETHFPADGIDRFLMINGTIMVTNQPTPPPLPKTSRMRCDYLDCQSLATVELIGYDANGDQPAYVCRNHETETDKQLRRQWADVAVRYFPGGIVVADIQPNTVELFEEGAE